MLSVSKSTLWRWENDGQLPSRIKISDRAVGWRYKDIDRWLNQREAKVFGQANEK
jgi:predicted DNA-binding transcriptional regulator AlpA